MKATLKISVLLFFIVVALIYLYFFNLGNQIGSVLSTFNYTRVDVFYATDRKRAGDRDSQRYYGSERGELDFGMASVSIPNDHRMGELEQPRWWHFEFRENPEEHVVLLEAKSLGQGKFTQSIRNRIHAAVEREVLVFMHGYNVTFEDAVRRTAQITYDLNFHGPPILYSWPSQGLAANYIVDETNARWTVAHFKDFLRLILTKLGAKTAHIIAHSMWGRVLAEALGDLHLPNGAARLRQIVFAAPDIDADTFRQLAAEFHSDAERVTLYASSNDKALKASKFIHGYSRAGESGPNLVIVDGVDTIDASKLETGFLGHSYYGDRRSILSDIFYLLRDGKGPESRFGLSEIPKDGKYYWVFQPN